MVAEVGRGAASARAALAGNPSDGYGGAVLAVTLHGYEARARARSAAAPEISPPSELVRAATLRFARRHAPEAASSALDWSTSIPRGVGLGGSSAIVIAALRALCELHQVTLTRTELAELALAVEVEELGIAAGLQDRVAQSYGGLTFMDFAAGPGVYEALDSALLPPLLVAWRADAGGASHEVHAPLRARYQRGEPTVLSGLAELAGLARRARAALVARDLPELVRCVDGSFDQRQRMLILDARHVEMVRCARACGAAANYAGSGGAIVAVCENGDQLGAAASELARLGCETSALAPGLVSGP
jgi:glucuronokinase